MRIKSQFTITMVLFGITLAIVSASVIITNQQVQEATKQQEIANRIAQGANELSYLSSDYLIYRESQQLSRWQTRYASFSNDVAALRVDKPEQQTLVRSIKASQQRLKDVFDSMASATPSSPQTQDPTFDVSLFQASWSRMAIPSQALVSDASRLSQLLRNQADQARQTNIIVILAMMVLFGAYFLANYLIVQRRLLSSIAALRAGTVVIGSGNLDFRIEEKKNDEIGELSQAFNQMAANLKEVTASKADVEAANKELEAFSYSVSHDLRAPLRHIDGFSKILLQDYADKLDEQGKSYLQFLREGSRRMDELIEAMLKLSRVTRAEMRRQPVKLSEIAQSIMAEFRKDEPERKAEFVVEPDIVASGDPQLLRIVLENLLGNAWKFTAKRPIAEIEFGVLPTKGWQDSKPVYFVKDNGAGFDMTYAEKLFTPFQRLHKAEEFPGTGIGLATVQRIIHRHGGRVWAEGEVGKGATFYFTLG